MNPLIKYYLDTSELTQNEAITFDRFLSTHGLDIHKWIAAKIRQHISQTGVNGGNFALPPDDARADQRYSEESIEDISILLEYLDEKKSGTSDFFKSCRTQLNKKGYLSPAQMEKIIQAAEMHIRKGSQDLPLLVGLPEVKRKMQIEYPE